MARERCYKCGEWNCDGGDSCQSDLYDNGVNDAIAAIKTEVGRTFGPMCDGVATVIAVREATGVKE